VLAPRYKFTSLNNFLPVLDIDRLASAYLFVAMSQAPAEVELIEEKEERGRSPISRNYRFPLIVMPGPIVLLSLTGIWVVLGHLKSRPDRVPKIDL
jgi:hypothetical protein